jgi:hypothetical protein
MTLIDQRSIETTPKLVNDFRKYRKVQDALSLLRLPGLSPSVDLEVMRYKINYMLADPKLSDGARSAGCRCRR